jgi:hypothetical protein
VQILALHDVSPADQSSASVLEPLGPGDVSLIPSYLPPGLTPYRVAVGYGAAAPDGQVVVFWNKPSMPMPAAEPILFGWRAADGPPPTLEAVELGNRSAVLIVDDTGQVYSLFIRSGPEECWMVGGTLPREELLRVAASLPYSDGE